MRAIELGHEDARDARAVGHKAANLARFAATFRVPPAFCLATSVYDELKAAIDGDAAARAELRLLVSGAYERLAAAVGVAEPRVAVRSSATGEDSADASFAGQHETILDVGGVDAVVDAVLECWRSVGNERVTAYRREKGITDPVSVAVLVQQMVRSEVSAIAFGVDPVSGDREVVVIDAAEGLGDRIASGEVTPDRYVVRKGDLRVSGRGVLSDAQAAEIAKLVLALERENGHEVDVECAFAGGELYLLQCRPITTLTAAFPVQWRFPGDERLHWRRDDAHFGAPVPRLVSDTGELGPSRGLQRRADHFDLPLRPRLEAFCGRMYTTGERRATTGELEDLNKRAMPRVRAHARAARGQWDEEFLPQLHAHYAWIEARTLELATLARADLTRVWDELWQRHGEMWFIHMLTVHAAFVLGDELAAAYEKLTGGPTVDALKLIQGRAPSLQQMERELYALQRLRERGETAALERAVAAFLAGPSGNLGSSGEDLRDPVWRDEPSLLIAELDRRIAARSADPDERHARLIAEGEAVLARVREQLRDRPEELAAFEELVRVARDVAPLTEEHNYHLDRQIQSLERRFFLALGARLVADGQLANVGDIYLFHVHELAGALRYGTPLHELARERTVELASWQRLRHPTTLGAPPTPIFSISTRSDLNYRQRQDDASVIKGVAASAGARRGPARLVRGAQDFTKLQPGDVLVCRSSNVSWVPLFTVAAAIVTDVGGALSHAAVVAREFGVPAVVGCGIALGTLRDGELVEVDGDAGTVRRIGR